MSADTMAAEMAVTTDIDTDGFVPASRPLGITVTPVAPVTPIVVPATERGWHDDPLGRHALRFHDGRAWTEHVTHFGPVPCPEGCNSGH